jgi:DNA-binding NtrC family response regulator
MFSLVATTGPQAGARFEIGQELAIGRSSACGVCLPDDARVSRRHAHLVERDGRIWLADLGSRNGTLLNGEKLEGEAPLRQGDRVVVGDTLFVFDPPVKASVAEGDGEALHSAPVESFMPSAGEPAAILRAAMTLMGCPSEAAALRRGAEEAMRLLGADGAAALLPGELGLVTAVVLGTTEVKVARPLLQAAERREVARAGTAAVAPMWAGGASFGLLYVERKEVLLDDRELGLLGALGRLLGEAIAAARSRVPPPAEGMLVGTNRLFRRALEQVRRFAPMAPTVFLSGEAGTGKALCAHYLHARSQRALGPFVKVDCRAPAPVLDEELFGRAASAGAPPRPSAFARADGGTLALLAVEVMPHELALRVAQELKPEGEVAKDHPSCDARVVATARVPLGKLLADGRIDPHFAQALSGVDVSLPPLRERQSDIPLLFDHFAAHAARVNLGRVPKLTPEAKESLLAYAWPGNVREIRLCAERLALAFSGQEISTAHLPREVTGGVGLALDQEKLADAVARLEKDAIAMALRKCGGKKIRVAAMLGISRPTLDKKLAEYKLAVR